MGLRGINKGSELYRYNAWVTLGLWLATVIAWILSIGCAFGDKEYRLSILIAAILGIGAISLTRACLSRATIMISDDGVTARFLGIRTRFISWREATKIVKAHLAAGYGCYTYSFQIYAEDHGILCRFLLNICGNIAFDERIGGLRQLLDQINLQAREHAIPLFVWDLEAIAKQRPLIKPKGQRGERGEVPVAQF